MESVTNWNDYHKSTCNAPPSETAALALSLFHGKTGLMIDLGCGSGKDSLYFLSRGWSVLAVDLFPEFLIQTRETLPAKLQKRLEIRNTPFENLTLLSAHCINASYSLPFCSPGNFPTLWNAIQKSLKPNGIFAGTFFGNHDDWAMEFADTRTFLSKEEVSLMFSGFQLEYFNEAEREGTCCGEHGEPLPKHWHEFHVVARKQS